MAAASVYGPRPHIPIGAAHSAAVAKAGFERFEDIPESQRKVLNQSEIIQLFKFLELPLTYQQRVKFRSNDADIAFTFSPLSTLLTLFQRLEAAKVLVGVYMKAETNAPIYRGHENIPFNVNFHFQIREADDDLDSRILSGFAHLAGVTYRDHDSSRTYWQGDKELGQISPPPPHPPNFNHQPECGGFLLRNGLGNYCIVNDSQKRFNLYTLCAIHNGAPLKINIHVVKKLDTYAPCSQYAVYMALHPLLHFLSSKSMTSLKTVDPRSIDCWAKSVDGYPIDMALQHMVRGEFSYVSKPMDLYEGLHIYYRLLSTGNECVTKGVSGDFSKMFLQQYFERKESKRNGPDEFWLREFILVRSLERELTNYVRDPVDKVCFLLNLEDWHFTHQTPQIDEIRKTHAGLLRDILGVDLTLPGFHFCKMHAFLVYYFTLTNERRRLYLELPFYSVVQFLAYQEEILASSAIVEVVSKYFPRDTTPDRMAVYKVAIRESFTDVEYREAFQSQWPIVEKFILESDFIHAWRALRTLCQLFDEERFRKIFEPQFKSLMNRFVALHLKSNENLALIYQEGTQISWFKNEFFVQLFSYWESHRNGGVELYLSFEGFLKSLLLDDFIVHIIPWLMERHHSQDLARLRCNPIATVSLFAAHYPKLAPLATPERLGKHLLFLLKANHHRCEPHVILNILDLLFQRLNNTKLRNEIVAILDAQHGFAIIEKDEKLRDFTFYLLSKGSEKMFKRGIDIYRRLATQKDVDLRILPTLMEHLLRSPFIENPKGYQDALEALVATCLLSENHCQAQGNVLNQAVALLAKYPSSGDQAWNTLKGLFLQKERYRELHGSLSTMWEKLYKILFEGQKVLLCGNIIKESAPFDYLSREILALLPAYFKLLFVHWDTMPDKCLEIFLFLEGKFRKALPLLVYFETLKQFFPFCPAKNNQQVEDVLFGGVARIKEEGKDREHEGVRKALEEHRLFRRFPKLQRHFVQPVEPAAASAGPGPAQTEAPKPSLNVEEALAAIKSKEPIKSLEQVQNVLAYFFKIDLTTENSLTFLSKRFLSTCERMLDCLQLSNSEAAISLFIDKLKEEERRVTALLESKKLAFGLQEPLLKFYLSHLFMVHISCQLLFVREDSQEKIADADRQFMDCMSFHLLCFQSRWFTPKVFLELWKKIVNAMISFPSSFKIFIDAYYKIYKSAAVDRQVFQEMRLFLVEALTQQLAKQGEPSYLEFALAILGDLGKEARATSKFPYRYAYNCSLKLLSAVIDHIEANGVEGPKSGKIISLSQRFCDIVNGFFSPSEHKQLERVLQLEEIDSFGVQLARLETLLAEIKKQAEEAQG